MLRTLRWRLWRRVLWNGNVEPPLRTVFTDQDHIVRWEIATRHKYRGLVPTVETEHPGLPIVRLRTPREVEA